ncbi:hypothetical protein [Pseudoalteromonas phage J2-1_QLiu-2017]|nr:hypothetical protein [Pseudoalteromonas phage J2-1_QLiu-2017]
MFKTLKTLALAAILVIAPTSMAASYTQSFSTNNGVTNTHTQSNNLTTININERGWAKDTFVGGGSGSTGHTADNTTHISEHFRNTTALQVAETGTNTSSATSSGYTSSGSVNGLSFSEGKSSLTSSYSGHTTKAVTGDVTQYARIKTVSYNGGAEIGKSVEVTNKLTTIDEFSTITNSGTNTVTSFTSSIGSGN